jgi:protein-lysine N-methyltransferase EEF2KMT
LLFDDVFKNPTLLKYPVKRKYHISFLKRFINELEKSCDEIFDKFYELLCDLIKQEAADDQKSNQEPIYSFRHFTLEFPEKIITIKENGALISNGTTGLKIWDAAIALSEFILNNKQLLEDKNILELGSGSGLLGLVAAKETNVKKCYVSDCHDEVLKLLKENLKINYPGRQEIDPSANKTEDDTVQCSLIDENECEIGVLKLPWEECEQRNLFEIIEPDILLAADIVYDNSVFIPLIETMNLIFSKNDKLLFILSCTVRNIDTLTSFLELLGELRKYFILNNLSIFHLFRLFSNYRTKYLLSSTTTKNFAESAELE